MKRNHKSWAEAAKGPAPAKGPRAEPAFTPAEVRVLHRVDQDLAADPEKLAELAEKIDQQEETVDSELRAMARTRLMARLP